jgi:hypothetical protein
VRLRRACNMGRCSALQFNLNMRAYKFRSSASFDFAMDIIFNRRLYCADWTSLNDPMEGAFVYTYRSPDETDRKRLVADVIEHKRRLRVCSLSLSFESHLLWAHYANGFDGIAIEVELAKHDPAVRRVEYGGVFGVIDGQIQDSSSVAGGAERGQTLHIALEPATETRPSRLKHGRLYGSSPTSPCPRPIDPP